MLPDDKPTYFRDYLIRYGIRQVLLEALHLPYSVPLNPEQLEEVYDDEDDPYYRSETEERLGPIYSWEQTP